MALSLPPTCAPEDHVPHAPVPPVSPQAIDRAARIFRALGEPSRLRLLTLLARGPACVSAVALAEGDELSTISQRLRVLRAEGLVSRRRRGKHIEYGLADQHVADLVQTALAHAAESRHFTQPD